MVLFLRLEHGVIFLFLFYFLNIYFFQVPMPAKLSFISIQVSFHFDDQFFLIYLKTKLLRINLKVEHFMLYLTIYDKNLKKQTINNIELLNKFFFKFISFWVDIFCLMMHILDCCSFSKFFYVKMLNGVFFIFYQTTFFLFESK